MTKVVFIKHKGSPRRYLFEIPADLAEIKGEHIEYLVRIASGEVAHGVPHSEILTVDSAGVKELAKMSGAYLPLAKVIGIARHDLGNVDTGDLLEEIGRRLCVPF